MSLKPTFMKGFRTSCVSIIDFQNKQVSRKQCNNWKPKKIQEISTFDKKEEICLLYLWMFTKVKKKEKQTPTKYAKFCDLCHPICRYF